MNADAVALSNIIDLDDNFTTINARFGSTEDFRDFVSSLHARNIKIIIDLTPSYTSANCAWFLKSINDSEYRDLYIWSSTPNNWVTVLAWKPVLFSVSFYLATVLA